MIKAQDQQSQTAEFIRDNIVKISDSEGSFYGTGFFIEVNQQLYCITCHHCIYQLGEIFVERFGQRYQTEWVEEYSDMKKDIAVLNVKDCTLQPLIYAREAMANFAVTIRGFSGETIETLSEGTAGRKSSLSDSTTPFEVKKKDFNGDKSWNLKPAVYVNVYECSGKFDLGFSGSPVCYEGPNKVVGIFTAKDENFGYVIPIQTLLDKFEQSKAKATQSIKVSEPQSSEDIQKILEEGDELLENKKFLEAIEKYNKVVDNTTYGQAIFNKAYALAVLGKNEEAIEWYDKSLAIEPNNANTLGNNAILLDNMGKHLEAIELYDKALFFEPMHSNNLRNKGLTLTNLGKYDQALECYDKSLKIEPNHADTLNSKGWVLNNLGEYEQAIEWYDKALAIDPKESYALNNKGLAFFNLGKYQEAIEWYDKALAIDPNFSWPLNNKGLALSDLGEYEQAIEWYDKALAIDPNYAMAMNNKGMVYDKLGKYQEAIEWYDKALAIDPNHELALQNKRQAEQKL